MCLSKPMQERNVLIIYTGGTIGMKDEDGKGLTPKKGYLPRRIHSIAILNENYATEYSEEQVFILPAMNNVGRRIKYKIREYGDLLDSSDVGKKDWVKMAESIEENYDKYDGFVILHGTDTLSYTASALSFMLTNLAKPIVVTGSQIPMQDSDSDGLSNIIGALVTAGDRNVQEVAVYFNNRLLRGNRTIKKNNSILRAFVSPNFPHLGEYETELRIRNDLLLPQENGDFTVCKKMCEHVEVVMVTPMMGIKAMSAALEPPTKGVILLTLGNGNIPKREEILEALKTAVSNDVLIVNVTQCQEGRVTDDYENGRILTSIGVIPGADMTPEAALTKLSYVLAVETSLAEKKKLMMQSLRGELTI